VEKPDHLRPERDWLADHVAGVAALALGVLAFIVVAISQRELWSTPDWRISVPAFVVTGIAALASIARRERGAYALWLPGLGLAAAALVLGWFLMLAVVVSVTAILILILHSVM
jgi:hypothetical protein